jgi:transposase-like protein
MMDNRQEFSVEKMSSTLGVSRSGFYKWLKQHQLAEQQADPLDLLSDALSNGTICFNVSSSIRF